MSKLSTEEVQKRLDKHNIKLGEDYKTGQIKTRFICFCGNEFFSIPNNIFMGHTTSCGKHLHQEHIIGEKHGNYTILDFEYKKGYKISCDCNPNKFYYKNYDEILRLKNKKCKDCLENETLEQRKLYFIGKKCGKLTVIDVNKLEIKDDRGIQLRCKCDCGNYKDIFATHFDNKCHSTCGNCELRINNIRTSQMALDIDNIISEKYKTSHNFNIEKKCNVDIFIHDLNIVVEYDSVFWHNKHKKRDINYDEKKKNKVLTLGYKLLRIISTKTIPKYELIFSNIDRLINGETYLEIYCK